MASKPEKPEQAEHVRLTNLDQPDGCEEDENILGELVEEVIVAEPGPESYTWWEKLWPAAYFLIGGIGNAIVTKVAVIMEAPGNDGVVKKFQKPWFLSTIIFIAMFCACPVYMARSYWAHWHGDTSLFLVHRLTFKQFCEFAIPAFSDMFEQIVAAVCIVYIGPSVDAMMKAGTLAGVVLINKFILKKPLRGYQWCACFGIMAALTLVGLAPVLAAEDSVTITTARGWVALIIILKIVSQIGYGVKLTYEQHMSQDLNYPEDMIVGVEGFWSSLMCVVCQIGAQFMPGEEGNGIREDSMETFKMIKASWEVDIIVFVSFFLGISYNMISTVLINRSSALRRTLIESFRTLLIWAVQLVIYVSVSGKWQMVGDMWTKSSFIQAAGFFAMTLSILSYNKLPRWWCFEYPMTAEEAQAAAWDGETDTNFGERTLQEGNASVEEGDDGAPQEEAEVF